MNREEVLRLAAECGIKGPASARQGFKMYASPTRLSLFADAIDERARQDEREACAKVCEEYDVFGFGTRDRFAAAIRARGEK